MGIVEEVRDAKPTSGRDVEASRHSVGPARRDSVSRLRCIDRCRSLPTSVLAEISTTSAASPLLRVRKSGVHEGRGEVHGVATGTVGIGNAPSQETVENRGRPGPVPERHIGQLKVLKFRGTRGRPTSPPARTDLRKLCEDDVPAPSWAQQPPRTSGPTLPRAEIWVAPTKGCRFAHGWTELRRMAMPSPQHLVEGLMSEAGRWQGGDYRRPHTLCEREDLRLGTLGNAGGQLREVRPTD